MPRRRPLVPARAASANAPLVGDPQVARAVAPLVTDIQTLQRAPEAVLVDGSRPPALGDDAAGDIWYRDRDGQLARLPAGSNGQVLTIVDGVPAWV